MIVSRARKERILADARAKQAKDVSESLDTWEEAHRHRIDKILADNGFLG